MSKEKLTQSRSMGKFRKWIIEHDDRSSFIIAYISIAVVLSTFISLFWLLVIVFIHFIFEYIKENDGVLTNWHIFSRALWELKLDIGLIFFAFVIDVYMGFVLGVAGLSGAARAGAGAARASAGAARAGTGAARAGAGAARVGARAAQAGTRFVVIQRAIRAGLMLIDEAVLVARGFIMGKKKLNTVEGTNNRDELAAGKAEAEAEAEVKGRNALNPWGGWVAPWTWGDKFVLSFSLASLGLLVSAPWLTEHDSFSKLLNVMVSQLHPWPIWPFG